MTHALNLGRVGIWARDLRDATPSVRAQAAAEAEAMGFRAIWVAGGGSPDLLAAVDDLLGATSCAIIATGILNIWRIGPEQLTAWWRGLSPERRTRVLLGLGVSHAPRIGAAWGRPVATMARYLDGLGDGPPPERLCLAALGPGMLDLARDRTAGAHPYLVPPEHTAMARERLGPAALLAPELGVILEPEPGKAREAARAALGVALQLPNYVNSLRRLGFTEDDVGALSDRLIDALFAWGDLEAIDGRVRAHLDAGADHVCLQVIPSAGAAPASPREAWRELSALL